MSVDTQARNGYDSPMVKTIWKYGELIQALDDNELYHVAKILRHGEAIGFFQKFSDLKLAKKRARSALSNHALKLGPPEGEIEVTRPYRAFFPAWYGKTWKKLIGA